MLLSWRWSSPDCSVARRPRFSTTSRCSPQRGRPSGAAARPSGAAARPSGAAAPDPGHARGALLRIRLGRDPTPSQADPGIWVYGAGAPSPRTPRPPTARGSHARAGAATLSGRGGNPLSTAEPPRRGGGAAPEAVLSPTEPRQLRKKPSRDAPCSPPYSCALRRTFIMADLLVDSRAPRSMCVRWRKRATSRTHRPPTVGVAAALRC